MLFGFMAITGRASAAAVAGIGTIGSANAVRAASGVAKAVVPTPAYGSDRSGTAITELDCLSTCNEEAGSGWRAGFFADAAKC